jgi:FMN phosphatase YigB (HAD superfamily)
VLQKKTLETHSLKQYFDDVVLCNRKTRKCFMDIKNRWNGDENSRFFVVGDGIKRDIEPGNKAGAVTVWTPGDFDPGIPGPGSKRPDYSIKDIGDLLSIIR